MREEHPSRLCTIWNELNKMKGRESWEVLYMHVNDVLSKDRRSMLPIFFSECEGFKGKSNSKWVDRARRLSCFSRTGYTTVRDRDSNALSNLQTSTHMMDQDPFQPSAPSDPDPRKAPGRRKRKDTVIGKAMPASAPRRSRALSNAIASRKRKLTAPDVTIMSRISGMVNTGGDSSKNRGFPKYQ